MAAAPESAGTGKGLIGWIDERFPLTKLWKEGFRVLRTEESQLLVEVWSPLVARTGKSNSDGHFPDDELQALDRRGLRIGGIHHARRGMGLADPLHAFHRCIGVLHRD